MIDELVSIDVRSSVPMETQSGLQNIAPKIFGRLVEPAVRGKTATIVMHPTSNFMGHYLPGPLAARGIATLALNSRYAGNDMMLIMERVLQDVGAGVRFLRERGFERIHLIGNSGGGALMAFYQAQAEKLTVMTLPDGSPSGIVQADLPVADGIVLTAAHAGRARLIAEWLDPSVIDERDPLATDPKWDLYGGAFAAPLPDGFVAAFRAAQLRRRDRIDDWVEARLRQLQALADGPRDQAFMVYRTHSDPRFIDLDLDRNDRAPGSIWGDPRAVNYGPNAMGRLCTLRSWLSQWSARSNADGPTNLMKTHIPVLLHVHTADGSTFPSTSALWRMAAGTRITEKVIPMGTHYLSGQPELIELSAASIADWIGA